MMIIVSQGTVDNTLRWLFSAQQQQPKHVSPQTSSPESATESPSTPLPTVIDPSQQTLRRFFQPLSASSPTIQANMDLGPPFANNNMTFEAQCVDSTVCTNNLESGLYMGESLLLSPCSGGMDVDMQMEFDSGIDIPSPSIGGKKWVGGIGWM